MPLSTTPRRTLVAGWIMLAASLGVVVFGAFVSAGAFPPGRPATLAVAAQAASQVSIGAAFVSSGGRVATFVTPVMLGSWVAYVLAAPCPRHVRRRVLVWTAPFFAAGGFLAGNVLAVLVCHVMVMLAPVALLGSPDSDIYTEGTFAWYGVGLWLWTLIVAYMLEEWRPGRPAHLCQHCGYDRTGLDAFAACPECGGVPRLELRRSRRY